MIKCECEHGMNQHGLSGCNRAACECVLKPSDIAEQAIAAAVAAERERIFSALETNLCLFLDGRNEYGTHVLPAQIGVPEDCVMPDIDSDFSEQITQDAESKGFEIGQVVFTKWRYYDAEYDGFGNCEIRAYWEYSGIDVELSRHYNEHVAAAIRASNGAK